MNSSIDIIKHLPVVNLAELAKVDFDGRIDTKFIFSTDKLMPFLEAIQHESVILQVNDQRRFDYRNLYFDTPEHTFFRDHQAGKGNRLKIRARAYSERGPFMFELKSKTNKGLTLKKRLALSSFEQATSIPVNTFLKDNLGYGLESLPNRTTVNYSRMTFSNLEMTEKFTLDLGLSTSLNNEEIAFKNLVIAEVKQEKFSNRSIFVKSLKDLKIYPSSFSKYCAAVMKVNEELKRNRFKPILRKVHKIEHGIH